MKLSAVAARFEPLLPHLRCPLCGGAFTLPEQRSLLCRQGHCFDLNTKGYVNLAPAQGQPGAAYDAALFAARATVCEWGFFAPVAEAVLRQLRAVYPPDAPLTVLDAGCGEGFYCKAVARAFPNATVLGVDLSRDAIRLAARGESGARFAVADLTRLPLRDHCADVLLDVLTPADYREFARVLKPEGLLIKAAPGEQHLREIRQSAASSLRRATHSSDPVRNLLRRHVRLTAQESVLCTRDVPPDIAPALLRMTPLTQRLDVETLPPPERITLHMELLVGHCDENEEPA